MAALRTSWFHNLIRGSDVSRHQLKMLGVGCLWGTVVAFVVSLTLAWFVFASATTPSQRLVLSSYARARLLTLFFLGTKPITLDLDTDQGRKRFTLPARAMAPQLLPHLALSPLRLSLWLGGVAGVGVFGCFLVGGAWYGRRMAQDVFERGAQLVERDELRALLARQERASPITLGGVPTLAGGEMLHFLLCGATGTGKTVALREMLDTLWQRGDRAIVYDPTGELVETYYRPDCDVLLNPLDARSPVWNLWQEVRADFDYAHLAKSLIPDQKTTADPFWQQAARLLFEDTARQLALSGEASNRALVAAVGLSTVEELYQRLRGSMGAALVDPAAERTAASVKMTTVNALNVFRYLPDDGNAPFSIRRWVETDTPSWLFISRPADQHEALKPLISCWLDIAVRAVMTLPPTRAPRLWLLLDEVASLQKIDSLAIALTQARKYGLCAVLGLQSVAQLRDLYGRDGAQTMMGMCQTWLVLRIADGETAKYLSDTLGQREIHEQEESYSYGAEPMRDGSSLQARRAQSPIVMPSEIQRLPDLTGYLALPGAYPVAQVTLRIHERPGRAPAFVARGRSPAASTAAAAEAAAEPIL